MRDDCLHTAVGVETGEKGKSMNFRKNMPHDTAKVKSAAQLHSPPPSAYSIFIRILDPKHNQ